MEFNAIAGVIVQIVGFVLLCRLGARSSDKLQGKSNWLTLGISGLVIFAGAAVAVSFQPMTYMSQTIGLFCVAFAGGMLVRLRYRMYGE